MAIGAWLTAGLVMMALFLWMANAMRADRALQLAERALREEFEAYARLDATLGARSGASEPARDLARRVCSAVARKSAFGQAALLLRDAEQRLQVMGSAGVDDLMLHALDAWGERFARDGRGAASAEPKRKSYPITLGPMEAFDPTAQDRAHRLPQGDGRAHVGRGQARCWGRLSPAPAGGMKVRSMPAPSRWKRWR